MYDTVVNHLLSEVKGGSHNCFSYESFYRWRRYANRSSDSGELQAGWRLRVTETEIIAAGCSRCGLERLTLKCLDSSASKCCNAAAQIAGRDTKGSQVCYGENL